MWKFNILKLFLFIAQIIVNVTSLSSENRTRLKFPSSFVFGVGTSSYQIEGGWNLGGKGVSIWDHLTHNSHDKIARNANADISTDSFHQWRRDVEMVKEMGLDIYRFSISWPRILPTGFPNQINEEGIMYYSNLIDECLRQNITPMVTIYHWELPQRIQEMGGWMNPQIVYHLRDYAEVLFQRYGDRVKMWTTINEPVIICEYGHTIDALVMAPAINIPGIPVYMCGHNILKAHAEVVHMYRDEFQPTQNGKIGITVDMTWPEPKTKSAEDRSASELALQFGLGYIMHPIFSKNGNYPQVMIDRIATTSKEQGFRRSRLPQFTQEEIARIRNTSDFFSINSYTTHLVTFNDRENSANFPEPSLDHDRGVVMSADPNWPKSGTGWLRPVPYGMYNLLMWINKEYGNPPVYVTENGVSDKGGLFDQARVHYFNSYLESILRAMDDGCNVIGYIAWSLMDSSEWNGYTDKYGLYHVDFNSPEKTRTAKMSAKVYGNIAKTHVIDWNFQPNLTHYHQMSTSSARRSSALNSAGANVISCAIFVAMAFYIVEYIAIYIY